MSHGSTEFDHLQSLDNTRGAPRRCLWFLSSEGHQGQKCDCCPYPRGRSGDGRRGGLPGELRCHPRDCLADRVSFHLLRRDCRLQGGEESPVVLLGHTRYILTRRNHPLRRRGVSRAWRWWDGADDRLSCPPLVNRLQRATDCRGAQILGYRRGYGATDRHARLPEMREVDQPSKVGEASKAMRDQ